MPKINVFKMQLKLKASFFKLFWKSRVESFTSFVLKGGGWGAVSAVLFDTSIMNYFNLMKCLTTEVTSRLLILFALYCY